MILLNRNSTNIPHKGNENILQFGGGNFLRGFVDWMIQKMNDKTDFTGSVILVKPTERGDYTALREQEGLFHVVLRGMGNGEVRESLQLNHCISRIIHVYKEWSEFLKTAEIPSIRYIVSNTTESGIRYVPDKPVSMDQAPSEFPAKLCAWLYHRYKYFSGDPSKGCLLLPCELIQENGTELKNCVIRYAGDWGLEQVFITWIRDHNIFYNTLVDRIVTGFPGNPGPIWEKTGFRDERIVCGEMYYSWILSGPDMIMKAWPFHEAGLNVRLVKDLDIHRQIKVRILNGAHTSLAPVACFLGFKFVHESIRSPLVHSYLKHLIFQEIIPALDHEESELDAFAESVFKRFANPYINHRIMDIALNSISKFQVRLLPTLREYKKLTGKLPVTLIFGFASLIRFYRGNVNGQVIVLKDDLSVVEWFSAVWENHGSEIHRLVMNVLKNERIWDEDLSLIPGLADMITRNLEHMEKLPFDQVLKDLLKQLD